MRCFLMGLAVFSAAAPAAATSGFGWPAAAIAAERKRAPAPPIDRDRFVTEGRVEGVVLSPDGQRMAWLERRGDSKRLWLRDLPAGRARTLLPATRATRIDFSRDGRWLFVIEPDAVKALTLTGKPGGGIIGTLRTERLRYLGADPWQPAGAILLEARRRDGEARPYDYRLWRVGPGLRRQLIAISRRAPVDIALGPDGHVAFAKLAAGTRHDIVARDARGRFKRLLSCTDLHRCSLLGTNSSGAIAFLSSDLDGSRTALSTLDRDGRRAPIAGGADSRGDIADVALDPASGAPVAVRFTWAGWRGLGRTLPAAAGGARTLLAATDGTFLAGEARGPLQGVRWWSSRAPATPVLDDGGIAGRLDERLLARPLAYTLAMADGMSINGLLTLPSGVDPARAPLVVMVHGGPWSHDETGYSATAQMLANRGFIVAQPQYRGSTGFGRDYLRAANGDFGDGRVQRDIEETAALLNRRGIGDPARSFIIGASFGGYSVLQALSRANSPFRAGVASVPPSDFGWATRWAAAHGGIGDEQGVGLDNVLSVLALDPAAPAIASRLARQSPLSRAAMMDRPLLLFAAGADERVPIRSVTAYAARLRAAGKPVDLVIARTAGHTTENPRARRAFLYLLDRFLAAQTGAAPAPPPNFAVRDWLRHNV